MVPRGSVTVAPGDPASAFAGGYVNFGYWEHIARHSTVSDRVESQRELYRLALSELDVAATDILLDLGCGHGRGTALALHEFRPARAQGVDAIGYRVQHAVATAPADERLSFQQGWASSLPCQDGLVDKLVSVQAVQQFHDLDVFASEAARVVRTGGLISLASFFAPPSTGDMRRVPHMNRLLEDGCSWAHPVEQLITSLRDAGFDPLHVSSIGEHVWHGFDAWLERTDLAERDAGTWLAAYEDGLLDYYVITARR